LEVAGEFNVNELDRGRDSATGTLLKAPVVHVALGKNDDSALRLGKKEKEHVGPDLEELPDGVLA
jgi:hypothetical protein